jgi:hypothetical protein
MRCAIVNKNTNIVEEIIIGYVSLPENYELIELDENSRVSCGWIKSENTFIEGE